MNTPTADFDLVILGAGASGLLLADALLADGCFDDHRILLVDQANKNTNDRTWCYWEAGQGAYDHLLLKEWDKAVFKSASGEREFALNPYTYKMLRSAPFYEDVHRRLSEKKGFELLQEKVVAVEDTGELVKITLSQREITAAKCCSSVRDLDFLHDRRKYPLIQQHFVGWFVETERPVFDENRVTLMDFSVPQDGNTRFMYILPERPNRALLEYTLFSADLLPEAEYEQAIAAYLSKMGVSKYRIVEKEAGNIPMSAFPLHLKNTKNLIYIGTAGGWTKASTGYTFHNSMVKVKELVHFMKTKSDFRMFKTQDRFDFYDRVFLEVLYHHNEMGAEIFSRMFLKSDPVNNFRFLDNQTRFTQELSILQVMPKALFLKYAIKILV
ncbi:lycopene cyclase family protein [Robertkochia flava]|uniref:lycopene cyclase family protein n=1 Tax=Robertkochia flava TaxID=3447986 RepID=UPI001CC93D1A|nr:lycopene cyclase family protein [Robertkochia marina]